MSSKIQIPLKYKTVSRGKGANMFRLKIKKLLWIALVAFSVNLVILGYAWHVLEGHKLTEQVVPVITLIGLLYAATSVVTSALLQGSGHAWAAALFCFFVYTFNPFFPLGIIGIYNVWKVKKGVLDSYFEERLVRFDGNSQAWKIRIASASFILLHVFSLISTFYLIKLLF